MQLKSNHYRALDDEIRKNYFLSSSFIHRLFTQHAYIEHFLHGRHYSRPWGEEFCTRSHSPCSHVIKDLMPTGKGP